MKREIKSKSVQVPSKVTKFDPYGDLVLEAQDKKSKSYLKVNPNWENEEIAGYTVPGSSHLQFGSDLCSTVIQFYQAIIPIAQTYFGLKAMGIQGDKEKLKSQALDLSRQFVKENKWIVEGFKSMFDDLTPGFLERVVGNIYLLGVEDQDEEDLVLSWFLIHYRVEKKLNISVKRLFDEEDDEEDEDGKVMTVEEFFGAVD